MRVVATDKEANQASWFGAKRFVKRALSTRPINTAMRGFLRHLPITPTIARLPVALPEVTGRVGSTEYVLMRPSRCAIAKELYWGRGGRVEREDQLSLELFADLAVRADVVLDVGANTGVFGLVASLRNPAAEVHAFEIVPEVYEVLVANIVRNNVAYRVQAHLKGIGDDGALLVVPSTKHLSSLPSSFASNMTVSTGDSGSTISFQSLDRFARVIERGANVIMKVDVEATEDAVFRGGWKTIHEFHPMILCEILVGATGTADIQKGLSAEGYHFYKITDVGLRLESTLSADGSFRDWLFCRQSPPALRALTAVPILA